MNIQDYLSKMGLKEISLSFHGSGDSGGLESKELIFCDKEKTLSSQEEVVLDLISNELSNQFNSQAIYDNEGSSGYIQVCFNEDGSIAELNKSLNFYGYDECDVEVDLSADELSDSLKNTFDKAKQLYINKSHSVQDDIKAWIEEGYGEIQSVYEDFKANELIDLFHHALIQESIDYSEGSQLSLMFDFKENNINISGYALERVELNKPCDIDLSFLNEFNTIEDLIIHTKSFFEAFKSGFIDKDYLDEDGNSLLYLALAESKFFNRAIHITESLVGAGLDPLAKNRNGQTTLEMIENLDNEGVYNTNKEKCLNIIHDRLEMEQRSLPEENQEHSGPVL